MNRLNKYLVFYLNELIFALHISVVEGIFRAVEVTPLPEAREIALGVVNVQGRIIPVINIRKRFHLPEREMELSDRLIVAYTSRQTVALLVDGVSGVVDRTEHEVIAAEKILTGMEYVEAVVKFKGDIIIILNLDGFLSLEEDKLLDIEMKKTQKEA